METTIENQMKTQITKALFPLLTITALAIAFQTPFSYLFSEWNKPEYGHGFAIPIIALWLGWHIVRGYDGDVTPSRWAIPAGFAGLFLFMISDLSTLKQISFYALLLFMVAMSLAVFGKALTWRLKSVFILLLFAIPLPVMIFGRLSLFLQMISSTAGVFLIELMHIPVYQDGNVIDLGTYKLQVVEACNGLRYLFPIVTLSFLMTCLMKGPFWKRAVLFLFSIPLAIGMNAARIAIAGLITKVWGPQSADGFVHMFEGYVFFGICLVVLFSVLQVLNHIGSPSSLRWELLEWPKRKTDLAPVYNSGYSKTILVFSVLAMSGAVTHWGLDTSTEHRASKKPLVFFPLTIEDWKGQRDDISKPILDSLSLTEYLIANYQTDGSVAPVNLYIAYYGKQDFLSSIHSPSTCIPGGGWEIIHSSVITLPVKMENDAALKVTRMVIQKGLSKQVVYFWIEGRGRVITNQFEAKWYLLVDSATKNRSDGALIRVTTPIASEDTEAGADARLTGFIKEAYPVVWQYIE